MPSSLCHHHDLPPNTPSRAQANKAIVGVGNTTPKRISLAAAVNSSRARASDGDDEAPQIPWHITPRRETLGSAKSVTLSLTAGARFTEFQQKRGFPGTPSAALGLNPLLSGGFTSVVQNSFTTREH